MVSGNRIRGPQIRDVSATVPDTQVDPGFLEHHRMILFGDKAQSIDPKKTQEIKQAEFNGYRTALSAYIKAVQNRGYSTRPVNAGAFGSVLLLEKNNPEDGEESRLAVKLSNTALSNSRARKMALQDFKLARYLNWVTGDDPSITRVHMVEEENSPLFPITMEYVADKTLSYHLKNTDLTPTQRLAIAIQAQQLREMMNGVGVIHRDYKPDNLFVYFDEEANPHLTVFDFGVGTKVLPSPSKLEEILSRTGFESRKWKDFAQRRADYLFFSQDDGMIVGTPAYSAPENIHPTLYRAVLGDKVMSSSDVREVVHSHDLYKKQAEWEATDKMSVAAIVYEVLTGEMLFSEIRPREGDGPRDARYRWISSFGALNYHLPQENEVHARWEAKLREKGYGSLFKPLLQATAVPWQRDDRLLHSGLLEIYSSLQDKGDSGEGLIGNFWVQGLKSVFNKLNLMNAFSNYREARADTEVPGLSETLLRHDRGSPYRSS